MQGELVACGRGHLLMQLTCFLSIPLQYMYILLMLQLGINAHTLINFNIIENKIAKAQATKTPLTGTCIQAFTIPSHSFFSLPQILTPKTSKSLNGFFNCSPSSTFTLTLAIDLVMSWLGVGRQAAEAPIASMDNHPRTTDHTRGRKKGTILTKTGPCC